MLQDGAEDKGKATYRQVGDPEYARPMNYALGNRGNDGVQGGHMGKEPIQDKPAQLCNRCNYYAGNQSRYGQAQYPAPAANEEQQDDHCQGQN